MGHTFHPEPLLKVRARALKFNSTVAVRRRAAGGNQASNREGADTAISVVLRWMNAENNAPGATANERLAEAVQVSGYP